MKTLRQFTVWALVLITAAATTTACSRDSEKAVQPGQSGPSAQAERQAGQKTTTQEEATATATRDQLAKAPYDATFLDLMIEHHKAAIGMASEAQKSAENEEIKQMAAQMGQAQQFEIEQMEKWRDEWYPDVPKPEADALQEHMIHMMGGGDHDQMHAMMQGEIPEGEGTLDQRFLENMIPHHQHAIEMSRQASERAEHQEVTELAQKIIADQEKEIVEMQRLQEQSAATR